MNEHLKVKFIGNNQVVVMEQKGVGSCILFCSADSAEKLKDIPLNTILEADIQKINKNIFAKIV